jgi:hypothetical protein
MKNFSESIHNVSNRTVILSSVELDQRFGGASPDGGFFVSQGVALS